MGYGECIQKRIKNRTKDPDKQPYIINRNKIFDPISNYLLKPGRIHGKTVADGWAGAVVQKPLVILKYLLSTDQHGKEIFH